MKSLALALAVVALMGCRREPVAVPCPEPPVITTPAMEYPGLAQDASSRDLIIALVRDWNRWKGFSDELRALLDAYRKPAPAKKEAR